MYLAVLVAVFVAVVVFRLSDFASLVRPLFVRKVPAARGFQQQILAVVWVGPLKERVEARKGGGVERGSFRERFGRFQASPPVLGVDLWKLIEKVK